jgi:hypothetical protein
MKTQKNISGRLQILVDQKLEGTLSIEGQKELEHLLFVSEEARSYAKQMEELHESLLLAGQSKKEISIEQEVLKKIMEKPTPTIIEMPPPFNIRMRSFNKEFVRYAAIFVIGLLLGSSLTFLVMPDKSPLSKRDIGATVSARSGQTLTISKDSWQIELQPVIVSDVILLIINARTSDLLQINLFFDHQAYQFEGTSLLSYETLPVVFPSPEKVSFEVSGSMVAQIALKSVSDIKKPFVLEVLQNETIIYKKEVLLP